MQINETDRAVARRVLRRIAGAPATATIRVDLGAIAGGLEFAPYLTIYAGTSWVTRNKPCVKVTRRTMAAAVEGAALGRAYAAALRGAK